jgi:hypothetical protein
VFLNPTVVGLATVSVGDFDVVKSHDDFNDVNKLERLIFVVESKVFVDNKV